MNVLEPLGKNIHNRETVRIKTVIFPGRWITIEMQITDAHTEESRRTHHGWAGHLSRGGGQRD